MINKVLYSRREYATAIEKEKTTSEELFKNKRLTEKLKELQEQKRKIRLDYKAQTDTIDNDIETLSFQLK